MARLVLKFGGTSLGTPQDIQKAANIIADASSQGHDIAVVVSAMAGKTNELVKLTQSLSYAPPPREYDVVLSTGEQVTSGLLAIALHKKGISAQSLLSWQLPVKTDGFHTQAHYTDIDCTALETLFKKKTVAVIPGFQGINERGDLTTTGRGGSDVTAVALAASLKADECLIYTDVPGVFTADPRLVSQARPLTSIPRACLMELARLGAQVIHPRAVMIAEKANIPLRILSTFDPQNGTIVTEGTLMEKSAIKSVMLENAVCIVRFVSQDKPGSLLNKLMSLLTEHRFSFDPLTQDSESAQTHISFLLPAGETSRFSHLCQNDDLLRTQPMTLSSPFSKVSIVGVGLSQNVGALTALLDQKAIALQTLLMNDTRISILVESAYGELTVRLLHDTLLSKNNNATAPKVEAHG